MHKIITHLWYDKEASEAAAIYTSLFENAAVKNKVTIPDTPSGDADMLTIELEGQTFMLISAGPYFKFTPAVSLMVACDSPEEVDRLYNVLIKGGSELMPLGAYDFSPHYAWIMDKFGLSWQLMFMDQMSYTQKITPTLMFVGEQYNKAEEAVRFYAEVFKQSTVGEVLRYGDESAFDKPEAVKHLDFSLNGTGFAAMDSGYDHGFTFNEAVSFIVNCDTQEEIDHYWNLLSAYPDAEQCGWLKDRYGLSWQITPSMMNEFMSENDPGRMARVTEAFLKMKKFDIAELKRAADNL